MEKEELSFSQKETKAKKIIPLLKGMPINDALDVLDFTKGYILDFATFKLPSSQPGIELPDKEQ